MQLQSKFFLWAWNTYPQARGQFWHVTNEMKPYPSEKFEWGAQTVIYPGESKAHFSRRIGQAKAAGLVPGVFDIHVFWRARLHIIEVKVGANGLTPEQVTWGNGMVAHGAIQWIGYDLETLQSIFSSIILQK